MPGSDADRVSSFVADLSVAAPDKLTVVEAVREVFRNADPEPTERIMYGGLVFMRDGELIAGVFPYSKHTSIEFSDGVNFDDPDGHLEGAGKGRRHLKIRDPSDLAGKQAAFYIRQAVNR